MWHFINLRSMPEPEGRQHFGPIRAHRRSCRTDRNAVNCFKYSPKVCHKRRRRKSLPTLRTNFCQFRAARSARSRRLASARALHGHHRLSSQRTTATMHRQYVLLECGMQLSHV